jgi:hypothetical protein
VACGVVRDFEPVYVDISSHELSADALLATDLPPDGSQPGATAACPCQLVGPGILTVPGGLCAIFSCNLAVVAALRAIFRCNPAVVDSSYAAVRSFSAPRGGSGTFVGRALTVGRRAISCVSVEIARRVITRLGLSVTLLGRDVTVPRSQSGLPAAHCRQLVGPGILTVLGRLCTIFGCNLAIVDSSFAAVRRPSASRGSPRTFVGRAPAVGRRAIPRASIEITGRVVTPLGLSVTQLGRDVTRSRSQPGLFAVLGGLCAIFGCKFAVVDRQGAVVSSLSAPQGGPGTFICRILTVARRAIPSGSVQITRRVVARLGLSVTQLGRDVTILRSQPSLPAACACQLVGPGILTVLGRLCTIFGCNPAVVDGSFAVVRSPGAPGGRLCTFVRRILAVASRAIPCGSVQITRRVVARFSLSVAQLGRNVTVLRSQPGLPAAHSCQLVGPGILTVLGRLCAIFRCNLAVVDGSFAVVRSSGMPRGSLGTFARLLLTDARRAIPCGSVEITRRVVTRFGLPVTHIGSQIAVAPF